MSNLPSLQNNTLSRQTADKLKEYLSHSKSANTWRAYKRHWEMFNGWCEKHTIDIKEIQAIHVSAFLTEIAPLYALSTIEQIQAALRFWFENQREDNPTQHPAVRQLMSGIRREKGRQVKQAPALRYEVLSEVCYELAKSNSMSALRDRLLLLMGYFGAFRRSEIVALKVSDLHESQKGFTVNVRKSKTDQYGKGLLKVMPYRKDHLLCPASVLKQYLKVIGNQPETPLFSAVNRWEQFSGKAMSDKAVDLLVKKYFGKEYSAHSLRAGFITDARKNGASDAAITAQTGQKAVTLERYTRFIDIWEMNAALDL